MRYFEENNDENERLFEEMKDLISRKKSIILEIKKLYGVKNIESKEIASPEFKYLIEELRKLNNHFLQLLKSIDIPEELSKKPSELGGILRIFKEKKGIEPDKLEKETLKRIKEKIKLKNEKKVDQKEYSKMANKIFSKYSDKLAKKGYFNSIENDLKKSNLKYTLKGYISVILLSTMLAGICGIILFFFFLFFNIEVHWPIIQAAEDTGSRAVKLLWMLFAFPIGAFIIAYGYPSLERKSFETRIDYELPFAVINMAAISGSMINPVKIFEIIISSGDEFPYIKKEFTKLVNEIHVYGSDLITALRSVSENTPSKKMANLLKGLAVTINSGGDLNNFFETRAESLLFEYKIEEEKKTKTAETFMDLYISIVIAAPMIFMLLLMMLRISGLGVSLPISTLTLIMVFGVAVINIFFLLFLHLKKSG